MKPSTKPTLRRALPWCALALLSASSAFAQTLLLSDNFDTAGDAYGGFNDAGNLTADQSGTAATKDYNIAITPVTGWPGAFQRGNGGTWLMHAGQDGGTTDGYGSMDKRGSLNYDIAAAANALSSPLEIKFNMSVSNEVPSVFPELPGANWTSFTVGGGQNPFVNDGSVGFSSLFRDNGGTQQFSNGVNITDLALPVTTFTDGDLITFVISDAAGTGSAFNSDGATDVVKMYVNGSLADTFTGLDLDATDQYISFHAYSTVANIDNLAITALAATPYETWATSFDPDIGLPAEDDDNDGVTNFEEFAFGLLPNSGSSVNPITIQLDKTDGAFSYTRRTGSGLNYSVWFSEDLAVWTEDTGATTGTPVPSGDNETVEVTLSTLPGDPLPAKLFIQVRAN